MIASVWVRGRFAPTNEALKMLRAEGYAEGQRRAVLGMRGRVVHHYTETARGVRVAVAAAAKRAKVPRLPLVRLRFYLLGHGKADPSAWYLVGKWAEDGLADAGVIGSDRFNVLDTGGRVVPDDRAFATWVAWGPGPKPTRLEGLLVVLREAGVDRGEG